MPAVEVDEYLSTSIPYDVPSSDNNGSCNNEYKAMKVGSNINCMDTYWEMPEE
jgi:hypothetical protein